VTDVRPTATGAATGTGTGVAHESATESANGASGRRRVVPHAMDRDDFVAAERYVDPAFAALERERLWPRVWQMACRLEEIPSPGDYIEYVICDQSLLVVRVDADTVKAYFNACRHRATELATGTGTFRDGRIICPFHGWRWDLDGDNTFVYGPHAFDPELLAPEALCLRQARVDTWGACVWINLDPAAPPLLEALDPVAGLLDPLGVADMRVVWWKETILPANWKMAQEAFMEGYHVPGTHPQLTLGHPERYDPDSLTYAVYDGGHCSFQLRPNAQAQKGRQVGVGEFDAILESVRLLSSGLEAMTLPREVQVIEGMRHRPIPDGSTFGAELVKAVYEYAAGAGIPLPPPDPAALARWGGMFFLFPNYFVLPQYGNALVYRVRPNGDDPESCRFELWSLSIPPTGQEIPRAVVEGPYAPDDIDHWPRIPLQDFSNIGRQQRGLHSRSFDGLRLSHAYESGITTMHRQLDRYLAS
jgi:phenylpropionate dioxygenase-like ring-hydroxylating dioxygenase large terminal subunit